MWMNDDIFFLDSMSPDGLVPVRCQGRLGEAYSGIDGKNSWRAKLQLVRDTLHDCGLPTNNFSTHLPYLFNAERMEMTIARFGLSYKLALETAYYNLWHEIYPITTDERKICFYTKKDPPGQIDGLQFLNISEAGMTPGLRYWITGLFPHKCEYEL